jgi:hypothetical protein
VAEDPLIVCGFDAHCPTGESCCVITARCFDPARPATCAVPPEGTEAPCEDDVDCARYDGCGGAATDR